MPFSLLCPTEVKIYKRKQENNQELDQESDQEKTKVFLFFLAEFLFSCFLGRFLSRVLVFLIAFSVEFLFTYYLVFFYKFPPQLFCLVGDTEKLPTRGIHLLDPRWQVSLTFIFFTHVHSFSRSSASNCWCYLDVGASLWLTSFLKSSIIVDTNDCDTCYKVVR